METRRLSINEEDIRIAGEIIRGGGLVAFPTETVYGLGANALDPEAVSSVYRAKGRPSDNPMIVHIAELEEIGNLVDLSAQSDPENDACSNKLNSANNDKKTLDNEACFLGAFRKEYADAYKIAEALWPGPLTIILPKSAAVPPVTTGGLDTVAVRMPSNETARALIRSAGCPVAAPSANMSGRPSPTTAEDVLEDMDGRIDAVIMGEQCDVGIESTVLDMTGEIPEILRPGAITAEQLSELIGKEVIYNKLIFEVPAVTIDPAEEKNDEKGKGTGKTGDAESSGRTEKISSVNSRRSSRATVKDHGAESGLKISGGLHMAQDAGTGDPVFRPKSPGMKYKHYSPRADVILIEGSRESFSEKTKELCLDAARQGRKAAVLDYGDDPTEAAHKFFADLRELDRQGFDLILVRALRQNGRGISIMNRMLKSAGYTVIDLS